MGHSGDSDEIPFMNSNSPPANDKERLQVLKVGYDYWASLSPIYKCVVVCTFGTK